MLSLNLPSRIPTKELYRRLHGAFRNENIALQSMLFNRLCFECGAQTAVILANSIGDSIRCYSYRHMDWKAASLQFTEVSIARRPYLLYHAIRRNQANRIRKQDEALVMSADSSY